MRLKPILQWYCDGCGEIIERPHDGTVEFSDVGTDRKDFCDFRIVHNGNVRGGDCQVHHGDVLLEDLVGTKGLLRLLEKQSADPSWSETVCRVLVPYYEEARAYFDVARANGQEVIRGKLSEKELAEIIKKYGEE